MRLRIRSTKLGKVRFTSHRDAARMWERGLRRANVPVALSQGFTTRPRISFGLALPTGAESIAEFVDVDLAHELDRAGFSELATLLSECLPDGFDVVAIDERALGTTSLQEAVIASTWMMWAPILTADDHLTALRLLDQPTLPLDRERKGRRSADDVRPSILDLRVADHTMFGDHLVADLATTGRGLRPSELARLAYPHVDPLDVRILRTHQWIEHDGERRELLPVEPPLGVTADSSQPTVVGTTPQAVLV